MHEGPAAGARRGFGELKAPALLALCYLLLVVAWAMTNPPAAAPDEYAHYLRALAAGKGILAPDERQPPLTGEDSNKNFLQWQRLQTRMIEVTGRFSPEAINCNQPEPRESWQCTDPRPPANETFELRTWVGTYPPYAYVLPGLFMRLGTESVSALLWGRLASALTVAVLLGMATLVLWDPRRGWICLLGLLGAVTPMVIFVGSSLTASGPEIAAGICFLACLMRLSRPMSGAPPAFVWATAGVSGALWIVSRDLGLLWIGFAGLIVLGLLGFRRAWGRVKEGGRWGWAAVAAIGCAVVAAAVWQLTMQVRPPTDLAGLIKILKPHPSMTREVLRHEIGVFGSLDTVMPPGIYLLWAVLILTIVGLAIVVGRCRERVVVIGVSAVVLLLPFLLDALQRQVGFGVQGRHVLPITVALPLVAGEVLYRNAGKLAWLQKLRPTLLYSLAIGPSYALCWYLNSKRRVVGLEGPDVFWNGLSSTPPYGWITWVFVVGIATLAMAGFGFLGSFPRDRDTSGAEPAG